MNSYNDFSEETKKYLNKVMDVYSTIKEIDISQILTIYDIEKNYQFTKLDKKLLSLFIAGFLTDGNIKEIFNEYDDIKLQDLLSFVEIKEQEIHKLDDNEYSDFYSKNFKLELISIINERNWDEEINFITPEVIVSSLQFIELGGLNILDHFVKKYNVSGVVSVFSEHPIFKALGNYILIDGSVGKKKLPKEDNIGLDSSLFATYPSKQNNIKPLLQTQNKSKTSKFDDNIWLLLDEIQKKFVGQELVVEGLFYNIVNNQQLAQMDEIPDGQRSIIFVDGSTGTGKTAIAKEITEKLEVPLVSTSITNYLAKGRDFTDILESLYKKADGDLEKAQRGIVVLDEFDKIIYSKDRGLEKKKAVQHQLLDFIGGGKYTIHVENSIFNMTEVEFDTTKLTFVCLGDLTDLRYDKKERRYLGFEKELFGRFNTYLHTDEYSKETLLKILKESSISPLIGFRKLIELRGKKLQIDNDVYGAIAQAAYELNTGARSLQTVMNNIRTYYLKEILRGKDEVIHLDFDTVISINKSTISKKVKV